MGQLLMPGPNAGHLLRTTDMGRKMVDKHIAISYPAIGAVESLNEVLKAAIGGKVAASVDEAVFSVSSGIAMHFGPPLDR